ncbi:MAG: class I lanthipeptide [Actinomycetota bacterium]|nr:class I lanthipeptide [Actinomycetota bacterium]
MKAERKHETEPRRKLTLTKETLRALTSAELKMVAGGTTRRAGFLREGAAAYC